MTDIAQLFGEEGESLLSHTCETIPTSELHVPGPDYIEGGCNAVASTPGVLGSVPGAAPSGSP